VSTHGRDLSAAQQAEHFLTSDEANTVLRFYEEKLLKFCAEFKPPMPKGVQGTSIQYFKRFYITNSVMDFHPKEVL
jgi:cyclin H